MGVIENLEKYLVKKNDIVIGMESSKVKENVALIEKEDENSILTQMGSRMRKKNNTDIHFVNQY